MKFRRFHFRIGLPTLLFVLCAGLAADVTAQAPEDHLFPVIYIGAGNGTNLGGHVGLGLEFPIDVRGSGHVSLSAAAGVMAIDRVEGDPSRFDYDFGAKIYPLATHLSPFVGFNYGLKRVSDRFPTPESPVVKSHGMSLSAGVRMPLGWGVFASGFIGTFPIERGTAFGIVLGRRLSLP